MAAALNFTIMKRHLFHVVLIFSIFCMKAQTSFGQPPNPLIQDGKVREFYLGWEAGINRSLLKNYYKNKSEKATKFKSGLFVHYLLNATWSFRGDLIYEEKGGKSKGLNVTYEFKYLSFSTSTTFTYKSLYVFSGFYCAYLLKATDDVPENVIVSGALKPEKFNKDDFGIKLGLGVQFLRNFSIEFCYDHGVASVYDYPLFSPSGHPRSETYWFRSRAYSLTLKTYLKKMRI